MKKIITIAVLLSGVVVYAQEGRVGINIEKPTATLEVKSRKGATDATKNLQLTNANGKNLVTVLDNGYVGINNTNPTAPLVIEGESNEDNSIILKNSKKKDDNALISVLRFQDSEGSPYGYLGEGSPIYKQFYLGAYDDYATGVISHKLDMSRVVHMRLSQSVQNNVFDITITDRSISSDPDKQVKSIYADENMNFRISNIVAGGSIVEKLVVDGAVKIGNTTNACTASNRGTIKYENDNFYGCKSTGWVLLNN